MQVTVEVPDLYAGFLEEGGVGATRTMLECLALEGYREGRFTEAEVASLLGYEGPMQVYDLFERRRVERYMLAEHIALDIAASDEQRDARQQEPANTV